MWMDNFVLNLPKEVWPKFGADKQPILFRFFEPTTTVVVLSASNQPEKETHTIACDAKKIPILKRKGGGGTVVLGPGCLILTFAFYAKNIYGNNDYFYLINNLWINALKAFGIKNLSQNGISDICLEDKKVAGTSIFRKKHLLVYQGSLLVNTNLSLISELLCYPSRAPSYRAARSHDEFITNLAHSDNFIDIRELEKHCHAYFLKRAYSALKNEFFNPE